MRRMMILPLTMLCFVSVFSQAQLIRSYGLKVGTTAASQNWQYTSFTGPLNPSTRWGLDVGAFVEWLNIPVFSISSELHYVQKGFRVQIAFPGPYGSVPFPFTGTVETVSPREDYLSILLLAKARLAVGSSSLYAIAGPRVDSYLATREADGFDDVLKQFRSNELGVTVGLGCEATQLGPITLGAEIRYSPTLQNSYTTNSLTLRNNSFELLVVLSR